MNEYEKKHLENKNSVIKCLEKSEQFFEKYGYEHELKSKRQRFHVYKKYNSPSKIK